VQGVCGERCKKKKNLGREGREATANIGKEKVRKKGWPRLKRGGVKIGRLAESRRVVVQVLRSGGQEWEGIHNGGW